MYKDIIHSFWVDIHNQNWEKLRNYFHESAVIDWINTNERFNVSGFIIVNSKYPMNWFIDIVRIEEISNLVVSLVHVRTQDDPDMPSFYATSFFEFENGKIYSLVENWGENGIPPQWRIDMQISSPIDNKTENEFRRML